MLSKADNEMMCRVGADTPMGKALRRFWLPVLQSDELPLGLDEPMLIELLGEKLVAFRDQDGKAGILAEACCHRGVSLGLGRVEACGLRCIYHGWMFDTEGKVLETPNVADTRFKDRVRQRAYPVREAGGLIWTFIGDAAELPDLPDFPWMSAPRNEVLNACAIVKANYAQVIEGILDSSHLSVLHKSGLEQAQGIDMEFARKASHMYFDAAPRIEAELTPWGLQYAALRNVDGKQETRVTAYISPIFVVNPNGDLWFAVVPLSDEKTAFFHIWWNERGIYTDQAMRDVQLTFVGLDKATLEKFNLTRDTCDNPDAPTRSNRWKQDRDAIRQGHFTGLTSFSQEDAIVSMSGGAVRDRSHETLATADLAIATMYRALLRNARAGAGDKDPAALDQRVGHIRGASVQLDLGTDWHILVAGNTAPVDTAISVA